MFYFSFRICLCFGVALQSKTYIADIPLNSSETYINDVDEVDGPNGKFDFFSFKKYDSKFSPE